MRHLPALVFLAMLVPIVACDKGPQDLDADNYTDEYDCDDEDAEIYPGAVEWCDDADNDCDGDTDEPDAADADAWYVDADGDGYGDPELIAKACEQPAYWSANGDDCDDTDEDVSPDATEVVGDGIDNDCNASTPD